MEGLANEKYDDLTDTHTSALYAGGLLHIMEMSKKVSPPRINVDLKFEKYGKRAYDHIHIKNLTYVLRGALYRILDVTGEDIK